MAKILQTTSRRRLVLPHRLQTAVKELLYELHALFDSLGPALEDDRWTEAASTLQCARDELVRPSVFYERLRALEHPDTAALPPATQTVLVPLRMLAPPARASRPRRAAIRRK